MTGVGARHQVVHRRQESVGHAHEGEHLDVAPVRQFEPPVAVPGAGAPGQALRGVADLQVIRVEVDRLVRTHLKRQSLVVPIRLVERIDANLHGSVGMVDHPHKSLPPHRIRCRREERHRMYAAVRPLRRRGQVRQVPGGARQQTHASNPHVGLEDQPPLAGAVAQRTLQSRGAAGLQLRSRVGAGRARRNRDRHARTGRQPPVVDAEHSHLRRCGVGVHQPQRAHLAPVAARIEDSRQQAPLRDRQHVVHRRQEAVRRADVGQRLDVEFACEDQPPVALARTRTAGQALVRVAGLQVAGVEVDRLVGADRYRQGTVRLALVVEGVHAHLTRTVGVVDQANETLAFKRVARGRKVGNGQRLGGGGNGPVRRVRPVPGHGHRHAPSVGVDSDRCLRAANPCDHKHQRCQGQTVPS